MQNKSVTSSSVSIAIIVYNSFIIITIKQQISLITKYTNNYISSNSRYFNVVQTGIESAENREDRVLWKNVLAKEYLSFLYSKNLPAGNLKNKGDNRKYV